MISRGIICEFPGRRPWLGPECKPLMDGRVRAINILALGTTIDISEPASNEMLMTLGSAE
jgi:hypothetical protein